MTLTIRPATRARDEDTVWQILQPAVEAGDTFCAPPEGGKPGGLAYFWPASADLWIAEADGTPLGCAYLRPNQTGNGAHVCNAGYCTTPAARGKGVARALLEHTLDEARARGYRAMQFNFVVATNIRAIAIWESHGFAIVGRLPGAFRHPQQGYVDALVMYRAL